MSDRLIEILKTKTKYGIMYVPIGDMQNLEKNKNYTYDYGHEPLFETKMDSFKIIHNYNTCKYNPSNVTYVVYCPKCSKYGQDSVTVTYIQTKHKKLRFYLTHSVYDCPMIRQKFNNYINANLLCDQCNDLL